MERNIPILVDDNNPFFFLSLSYVFAPTATDVAHQLVMTSFIKFCSSYYSITGALARGFSRRLQER